MFCSLLTYVYLRFSNYRLQYEAEEEMFLVIEQVELYHSMLKLFEN